MAQRTLALYFGEDDADVLDWIEQKQKETRLTTGCNIKVSPMIIGLLRQRKAADE